ncbi:MAG: amidase [Anaerolineae bacterium]
MQITDLTLSQAADQIAHGELSPVALTEAYLARIAALNPTLNAYLTVTAERALEIARRAEQDIKAGHYRGPLHGIPVGVKDLYETAGVLTTVGTVVYRAYIPNRSAHVVDKLEAAGAVLLGKLNMHEIALGVINDNPHYGRCCNPYNLECSPGGSSGGSGAALAARLCLGSLGSDTRGSIRIPAALCGVVGLKPTYGRLSLRGVMPLAWSLDHAGPMARTVEDCALIYMAIAGYDPNDPYCADMPVDNVLLKLDAGVKGVRIGVPRDAYFREVEPEVAQAFEASLIVFETLGARLHEVDLSKVAEESRLSRLITSAEAGAIYADQVREHPELFGADVLARLKNETGTASDYARARRAQVMVRHEMAWLFREYDLLMTPTTPFTDVPFEDADRVEQARARLSSLTAPFNMAGVPTISVPNGIGKRGIPTGLQIAAPMWTEGRVFRAAYAFEQATDWHKYAPKLT